MSYKILFLEVLSKGYIYVDTTRAPTTKGLRALRNEVAKGLDKIVGGIDGDIFEVMELHCGEDTLTMFEWTSNYGRYEKIK